MMFIGCFQSLADQDNKRFVEFQKSGLTQTYDLSIVQMLQPGRFTIVSTQIDDADVMKLELKVLDTLRTYCEQPDGKYPAPTDLFVLGPPDLPIATIHRRVAGVTSHPPFRHASLGLARSSTR